MQLFKNCVYLESLNILNFQPYEKDLFYHRCSSNVICY